MGCEPGPAGSRVQVALRACRRSHRPSFPELSDYWQGGFGARAPQDGGAQTVRGASLALAEGTLVTGLRLLAGMALALIVGGGLGLALGYLQTLRRFAFAPLNFLGVLPLLAMLPLFAYWFGATTKAAILFIGFGAGVTILRATLNAVENVPRIYIDNARTLGASGPRLYRTIIIPAILPELGAASPSPSRSRGASHSAPSSWASRTAWVA